MTASTHTGDPLGEARARMKAAGLRVTRPRLAVLGALRRLGRPSSAGQVHAAVASRRCDLVTVYRCLAAFEEIGLARRRLSPDGTRLYGLDAGAGPGHHVVCRESGRIDPLDAETAAELDRALENAERRLRDRGYTGVAHVVEFFGTPKESGPG